MNPYRLNLPSLLMTRGIFIDAGLFQSLDMFLYEQNPGVSKGNGLVLEVVSVWNPHLRNKLCFHSSLDEETGLLFCREGIIIVPFYGKVFTCVVVFGSVPHGMEKVYN